jgi:SAM-dependent methyltransferase
VDSYLAYCGRIKIDPFGITILEIGPGSTNSTGYEIVARIEGDYIGYDPYCCFDPENDRKIFLEILERYELPADNLALKVSRISNMKQLKNQSVDLILSYSVLEHVKELPELFGELKRVLKKDGHMIHFVDYRDHFFKYPLHFLQFSDKTWDMLFNPGDLPRYRLDDHLTLFHDYGFFIEVLDKEFDHYEYEKIKNHIFRRFKDYHEERVSVLKAALIARHSGIQ